MPSPDDKTWTEWVALEKYYAPKGSAAGHRWAQVKIEMATDKPQASPRIAPGLQIHWEARKEPAADTPITVAIAPRLPTHPFN